MANTTYIDGSAATPIIASWLNDVNKTTYAALGSGGVAPTTPDQVKANIGADLASMSALRSFSGATQATVRSYYAGGSTGGGNFVSASSTTGWYGVGAISGITLTVSSTTNGAPAIGQQINYAGSDGSAYIISGSGTSWTLNKPLTVPLTAMTGDDGGVNVVALDGTRWKRLYSKLTPHDFGAMCSDFTDTGSITAGSSSLSVGTTTFQDGQWIAVIGAGSSGADLVTCVVGGGGTNTLTLQDVASTTVSGAIIEYDDLIPTQAAIDYCWRNGVSTFNFPDGGHYKSHGQFNSYMPTADKSASLRPRTKVSMYGNGCRMTTYNNSWYVKGMYAGYYETAFSWYLGAPMAEGANSLSFSSMGAAANFTVGGLYVLASVTYDSLSTGVSVFPSFVQLVKVRGVDSVNNKVTFYESIDVAIGDPQLGYPTDTTDVFCEGMELTGFDITADYNNGSQAFSLSGTYRCDIHDNKLTGTHGLSTDGFTKSQFRGNTVTLYCAASTGNRVYEVKSGSSSSYLGENDVTIVNVDGNSVAQNLIDIGERSRNIRIGKTSIAAAGITVHPAISTSDASGIHVKDITGTFLNIGTVILLQGNGAGTGGTNNYDWVLDQHVSGVSFTANQANSIVTISAWSSNNKIVRVSDITVNAIPGDPLSSGISPTGVLVGAPSAVDMDFDISDIIASGFTYSNSGATPIGVRIRASVLSKPSSGYGRAPYILTSAVRDVNGMPDPTVIATQVYSGTVANADFLTFTAAGEYPYLPGDKWRIKICGYIAGTANAKNIAIADSNGSAGGIYALFTWAAADQGAFELEADLICATIFDVGSSTTIHTILQARGRFNNTTDYQSRTQNLTQSATASWPIYLQAWVANSADAIYIDVASIEFLKGLT